MNEYQSPKQPTENASAGEWAKMVDEFKKQQEVQNGSTDRYDIEDDSFYAKESRRMVAEETDPQTIASRQKPKPKFLDKFRRSLPKKYEDIGEYRPNADLPDDAQLRCAEEVLTTGSLAGQNLSTLDIPGRWNHNTEESSRLTLAKLFLTDPKTATEIVDHDIVAWHGSSSRALETVLQNGLQPADKLRKNNIPRVSGEPLFAASLKDRQFISFTPDIGLAADYSTNEDFTEKNMEFINDLDQMTHDQAKEFIKAGGEFVKNRFPVMYGIDRATAKNSEKQIDERIGAVATIHSDISQEFGIFGEVPPEYIKMIAVPKDKQLEVRKMLTFAGLVNTSVVPIESLAYAANHADPSNPPFELVD